MKILAVSESKNRVIDQRPSCVLMITPIFIGLAPYARFGFVTII
jgi:hypothetical protein